MPLREARIGVYASLRGVLKVGYASLRGVLRVGYASLGGVYTGV